MTNENKSRDSSPIFNASCIARLESRANRRWSVLAKGYASAARNVGREKAYRSYPTD